MCLSINVQLKTTFMHTKTLILAIILSSTALFGQAQQETLFKNAKVRGGFGGPIFSWSNTKNQTGYGAGGGGGVVFDRFFIGLFGMGETLDNPTVGDKHLAIGYGGLWMGYTVPAHKVLHLFTSLKIAGGAVGVAHYDQDWNFEDDWNDVAFVAIPEAGLELNIAKWLRLSGSVGYRFVNGFDGWQNYGKKDLNAAVYNVTLRFGFFGK